MGQRPYFNQGLIVHFLRSQSKWGSTSASFLLSDSTVSQVIRYKKNDGDRLHLIRQHPTKTTSCSVEKRRRRDGDKQLPTAMLLTPTISKLAKKRRKRKDGDKQLPTVMHPMPTIYKLAKRKKKKRDG